MSSVDLPLLSLKALPVEEEKIKVYTPLFLDQLFEVHRSSCSFILCHQESLWNQSRGK